MGVLIGESINTIIGEKAVVMRCHQVASRCYLTMIDRRLLSFWLVPYSERPALFYAALLVAVSVVRYP